MMRKVQAICPATLHAFRALRGKSNAPHTDAPATLVAPAAAGTITTGENTTAWARREVCVPTEKNKQTIYLNIQAG